MNTKKFFVATWGESKSEVENYLKYNAKGVELILLGVSTKIDKENITDCYLFEAFSTESDMTKLTMLNDVEVFQ